ncbi:MAG: hypothetical protein ACJATF_003102, partial [Flavobacteriales bacterium]
QLGKGYKLKVNFKKVKQTFQEEYAEPVG